MTVLVVGASGATGRLLVAQLLGRGCRVRAVVRSPESLPQALRDNPLLSIVTARLLDLGTEEMNQLVNDCSAVASCLGHNLTFRGLFCAPRKLVTDAVIRLSEAVRTSQSAAPIRFVLMNTAGNRNRGRNEAVSFGHRLVIGLIRLLLPPQRDNETAADYLRTRIGTMDRTIEWVAVRPDTLINEDEVSRYVVYPSPTRCAVFNPGRTSRINVAHFMADLITDQEIWSRWRGEMPVIYNQGYS